MTLDEAIEQLEQNIAKGEDCKVEPIQLYGWLRELKLLKGMFPQQI